MSIEAYFQVLHKQYIELNLFTNKTLYNIFQLAEGKENDFALFESIKRVKNVY